MESDRQRTRVEHQVLFLSGEHGEDRRQELPEKDKPGSRGQSKIKKFLPAWGSSGKGVQSGKASAV